MYLSYLSIPLIGSIIGWVTNILAIKLIFHPYKPFRIPFLKVSFQGLIPKRKNEIAETIGDLIEEQLLNINDVMDLFTNNEVKQNIDGYLIPTLKKNFKDRLPGFLPLGIKENAANIFEEILKKEAPGIVGKITNELTIDINDKIKFSPIIQKKIKSLDMLSLEKMILRVTSKELRYIEFLGAVLGFIIGIFQLIIVKCFV